VLQCDAFCCSVLLFVAVCFACKCSRTVDEQESFLCCSVMQFVAVCYSVLQCVAV